MKGGTYTMWWRIPLLLCLSLIGCGLLKVPSATAAGDDEQAQFYELKRGNFSVKLTNWGASVVSVILPDRHGELADVVLGFDSPEAYKPANNKRNFGAIVGRVANRIKDARFNLSGTVYHLIPNSGNNSIHGGPKGFSKVRWNMTKFNQRCVIFGYESFDGEEGFPGAVSVSVKYMLVGDYSLSITMTAKALNKATPVNLAHHSWWNLAGHNSGDILDNVVQIFASNVTEQDEERVPTGNIVRVKGTPYDFLQPRSIASKISKLPNGYDINYVVDGGGGGGSGIGALKRVATVHDRSRGRVMEVYGNQPGVQFFTGNSLKNVVGKGGFVYGHSAGLCLETQGFPDAVNHPNFPTTIVQPESEYKHLMLFRFSTK